MKEDCVILDIHTDGQCRWKGEGKKGFANFNCSLKSRQRSLCIDSPGFSS